MIAVVLGSLREHLACQDRRKRRQRILASARRLERVAAQQDSAVNIASLARDCRGIFEFVIIRLELGVGDPPVLHRHVGRNEVLAVTLLVHGADLELHVGPAPSVTAPVHGRAAHDLTGQERAKASHRQRFLRRVVADSERVARGVLHEGVAYHEAQLVATIGTAKSFSGLRIAPRSSATTLSPASVNSFARMPPVQPSPTMTASTSFNFVAILPPPQLMSAMLTGSAGKGLSRYFSTFSRCTAITPGKPISRQPTLLRLPP